MLFLVCSDLHLKPAASDYDIDAMAVPDDVDAALILGDLTHRAGQDDVALARRFIKRFGPDIPVVYIPGNHDPAPTDQRIVDGIPGARSGHQTICDFGDVTIAGWGCEQRTLSPALDQSEFDVLDPRNAPRQDRRYVADQVAADIEEACHEIICRSDPVANSIESLGITESEQSAFYRGIEEIEAEYDMLTDLLEGHEDILLLTHVPPFNTSFDRHHAVGSREVDREFLHVGSIAVKLAIREHDVFAALSGHSHTHGYDIGQGSDGRPYCLNLGYRGIGTVTASPRQGQFAFTQATTEGS